MDIYQQWKMQNFEKIFIIAVISIITTVNAERSFKISTEYDTFMKDGEPFFYVSGSLHYSRVPYEYWEDRLVKCRAAGLDAIQVYVPWNFHETTSGDYNFNGSRDIVNFLNLAQKHDLLVILRAGPYICGEWEYGGFPAWILKQNGSIVVRTMDPGYIKFVDRWFSELLPRIKPLLYGNGGPIIMVQVENEYGSYFACDRSYMAHLRDMFRSYLGEDIVLFTTDGSGDGYLKCGAVDGVYATVDFGPGNVTAGFEPMRKWNPKGPLVNSEFYTGWLDHWGSNHATGSIENVVKSLDDILSMKASVNMYMMHGGTNFAYWNGADPEFEICPTSYDYDAPLTEAGDITDKYLAVRNAIGKFKKVPPGPLPQNTTKAAYGIIPMMKLCSVLECLDHVSTGTVQSDEPLSMEQVGQNYGFILYRHVLQQTYASSILSVPGIRDRGYVMLDEQPIGLLDRNAATAFNMIGRLGQTLNILVENQGRINYGSQILEQRKGIIGNVTLGGKNLTSWEMISLDFSRLADIPQKLVYRSVRRSPQLALEPSFYVGSVYVDSPADTFLDPTGWSKGQAYINNYNLGRYWPDMGPQVTLFAPAPAFHKGQNQIFLVELEWPNCLADNCSLKFSSFPYINKPTIHGKVPSKTQMLNGVNECSQYPCENSGKCEDALDGFNCICDGNFEGEKCTECKPGFKGDDCKTKITSCSDNPCRSGGKCVSATGGYTCQCPSGYSGDHCEISPHRSQSRSGLLPKTCGDTTCKGSSHCEESPGKGPSCKCDPGYDVDSHCTKLCKAGTFGQNCIKHCHCKDNVGCDHVTGECENGCAEGYEGFNCAQYSGKMAPKAGPHHGLTHMGLTSSIVSTVVVMATVIGAAVYWVKSSRKRRRGDEGERLVDMKADSDE